VWHHPERQGRTERSVANFGVRPRADFDMVVQMTTERTSHRLEYRLEMRAKTIAGFLYLLPAVAILAVWADLALSGNSEEAFDLSAAQALLTKGFSIGRTFSRVVPVVPYRVPCALPRSIDCLHVQAGECTRRHGDLGSLRFGACGGRMVHHV